MYNINTIETFLEVVSLHVHIVIALYRLDGNEELLEIFGYSSNSHAFHGPDVNL